MASTPPIGFLLHDVSRLLRKRFEQRARHLGLTRSQWQVLATLAVNEGIHQGGLAEILDIEAITLVRLLDKIEERGLIERRRHPTDRRVWQLFLKPEAHPFFDVMWQIGEVTRGEAFAGISEKARNDMIATLTQMKSNLSAACGQPVDSEEANHE
ncbi:MarR family winged helix-turn-helix transcriptional regulator [Methylovirgula sp. 4M-Z18]|uniref:MarR family winged helix-turn-helix transcriptional regulator n=1 Tax=Methylovirgula sp. 4M-Z18 TaxID=2293567 RepID=UPI000E2ECE7A|nr:MarR family transcriptional regulator [Methylovirgula sp. 4M-Z18]RFB79881.1 MarR family transcriptional regulator [Methylovirgula sp. 4M-Z18]